jgi:hypothetical protein
LTKPKLSDITSELTDSFVKELQEQIAKQVQADVMRKLAGIDLGQLVGIHVDQAINRIIKETTFPERSINGAAIKLEDLVITGDNVVGGIVKNFGSTGIQDSASTCQVTILDNATVIENKLVAAGAEIKGSLVVDGDLILTGEIPTDSVFFRDLVERGAGLLKLSMDGQFFLQYADKVFDKIKSEGIDLSKLTIDGREILSGNKLGDFVTETNIQKVGELRNLTVVGDSLFVDTLYVGNKRVGINTTAPAGALSVWDEECEVVVRKYRKDVSMIGSLRPQQFILSSNNKNNLVLETDGSVTIKNLTVGAVEMSSAQEQPQADAPKGTVIFNENPDIGTPLFWVSLGGARWAQGPKIG